jgi:NADH-quinone oxidoreductase subunit N
MILSSAEWIALLPVLIVAGTAVVVMLAIAIRRHHAANATLCVIGLNLALLSLVPVIEVIPQTVTPLLVMDGYAVFYSALILVMTLATATLAHPYLEGHAGHREELYLLLTLAALGGIVLTSSVHFASFFLGLEILTVSLYGMVAYLYRDERSLEAGVKYLILSAVASAFLLFGMALVYSQTGTMAFAELGARLSQTAGLANPWLLTGAAMILVGVGFKLSLAPFHLWTPDVYEGAPAPVGAFLATVSKAAVFALLLRWFTDFGGHGMPVLLDALTVIAITSILVGNVLALLQVNFKRLLAYSSIAHMGYLLVALIAAGDFAVEAVAVYLITYTVTALGAFGVMTLMSSPLADRDADQIYDYRGLFWRRPFLTAILTAMMLSMAGIPVTAGFIGKFYILAVAVDARLWWLVGAVVLGSAIGLYYYLRVIIALYLQDPQQRQFSAPLNWGWQAGGLMVLGLTVLMFVLGLYPEPVIALIRMAGLSQP